MPMSAAATFCATLVDEWVRLGVSRAVVAPGSRSTPMALALAGRDEVSLHVVHDERVAAFVALGMGLDGVPAVLLCTSGTAAANFLPAVVEAGLSEVPMLVLTADRPPELRDVGSPQTIDQTHLFGRSVRWFHDPGAPDHVAAGSWRSLGRRSFRAAIDGPVHLNLPFREPLVGDPGPLPSALPAPAGVALSIDTSSRASAAAETVRAFDRQRGVIVAGGRSGVSAADIAALSEATGWPVLADPTSGARHLDGVVTSFDVLLRHDAFADAHVPEVVVRIGRPPASKVLAQWLAGSGAVLAQVGGPGMIDPDHTVAAVLEPGDLVGLAALAGASGTPWLARWQRADERAQQAMVEVLGAADHLTEPAVARTVAEALPDDVELVVASSMPVRDLEWYGGPRARAHANRGANGIDGVMSTALGRALTGVPTAVLLGDIAAVHDSNALVGLMSRAADLRIVVVDNDGGGIFSFLPQASSLTGGRFEQLFGTPHGTDVVALAGAHGIPASTVTTRDELADALVCPGPWLVRVPTDRAGNVEAHAEIHAAVAAVLDTRP
ncbi:MAG: 2-succinyl-5-enolpyruvyl-6-hydroxy-3-cyclohexene-1-carboxylic-acid synthase [Ilumatobacter sp.]|nr:MAG: 2-succinyl-5-enolpyruvyl-6-hydroxy-3-cyclohexene-1-carboxylic-acid synthase [Ilumatobacter sp.]